MYLQYNMKVLSHNALGTTQACILSSKVNQIYIQHENPVF